MLYDGQGRCLRTNRSGLSIMGYYEGDLIGKKLTDIFPEECRPDIEKAVESVLAGEQSFFDATQRKTHHTL